MFTKSALCIVALGLSLSATAALAEYKQVKKEDDFRTQVVGKTIVFGGGTAVVHADGKTDGKLNKQGKYYGVWNWQGKYYCRNLVISGKETGTKCLKVETDGSKLRLTQDKGKGRVIEATLK